VRWPRRSDWLGIACLGLAFFGLFFILYNVAIGYTTAARASLALSTLPLQTMFVGGLFGLEKLTPRKSLGVGVAVFGVLGALASGLSAAPPGAWRGELIMIAAAFSMACYNVWSRPFIQRASALGFLTVGMGFGAAALIGAGVLTNRVAILAGFSTRQWLGGIYLGVGGGAVAFILWVLALERATPTRVASTMAVNPIAAALLASQLVGEPIAPRLIFGLVAVLAGIWVAATESQEPGSGLPAAFGMASSAARPAIPEANQSQHSSTQHCRRTALFGRLRVAHKCESRRKNSGGFWNGED
jgi:drug/metabolite transporter (DMT)-like permease